MTREENKDRFFTEAPADKGQEVGERTALYSALSDERSQQLIKQAHHEWLSALDAIQDPIFIHDKECRVTRSNRAYAEYAGMSVKQVIGKPYYEMFPIQDGPLPYCEELIRQGGVSEEEVYLENGKVFLSRATAILDGDGRHMYSLHIMYDITERKRMEQALREGEERLRLALGAAHQAWFDVNVQTGMATISPEYAGMVGYEPAEFDASLQHWMDSLHPDDRDAVLNAFQASLSQAGAPPMEYRRRTKSGDWKWIRTIGKVVGWDAQQRPLRMVGIHTDITERKQAELALVKSEARFRSMFESLAEGVLLFGKDEIIQTCNPAAERILGLGKAQLVGAGMLAPGWIARREDMAPFAIEELPATRTLKTGESQRDIIICLEKPPGMLQWLSVNSEPIHVEEAKGPIAAIVSFEDVTERKRSELEQNRLNRALKALSACNHELVYANDEMQLLQSMCRVIVEIGGYRMAWVGYLEHDAEKSIRPVAQDGFEAGYLETAHITWADTERGQGPTGRAAHSGQMQVAQNILLDPSLLPWRAAAEKRGYAASIALPLVNEGGVFGVLTIYAAEANAFTQEEVKLLQEMAEDLSFGIGTQRLRREQVRITEQLREGLEETVQVISSMVELRDPYTAGHERRVADMAAAIASEMGLSEEQVHGLHLAGNIHDLGKIQVPAEILSKPGRLTEVEFNLIKMHPQTGYEILKNIEFPWPVAQMVLQHHERIDGSGYPQGLKGDAILLEARILGVADVVEAMASHRPYRPGLGLSAALDEIRKNRGVFYDPGVVDACVRLFEENKFPVPAVWSRR